MESIWQSFFKLIWNLCQWMNKVAQGKYMPINVNESIYGQENDLGDV